MTSYASLFLSATLAIALAASAQAQSPPPAHQRVVQRNIPMTAAIRRAFAAGTRDSTGRPGARYWQLRTDYTIHARVDPSTSRLHGRETVVIANNSPDSLSSIVLRLDHNLFTGFTPHAAPWVPGELTDGMVVSRMSVDGRAVNLASQQQQQQQGQQRPAITEPRASGLNMTSARVQLPSAIPAGGRATLDIEWSTRLPGGNGSGHRMTQRWGDTLYQPTQWYPRVAVYDDLRGWDSELYLGPAEFYNNFGRFDVRIEAPAGWVVSGTGVLQNPQEVLSARARERLARALETDSNTTIVGQGERIPGGTWHFVADTVNDFAFATARDYVWQVTRATIPGKGPVPIHMVFLPGRARFFANAGPLSRHALEFYSRLWFPYQFPQLTLQDGPSAGMEYPMVINSNQGAADHEAAHQWWPMVVSNNETWYGWMDEGFNNFMNILSGAARRGQPANLDRLGQGYGQIAGIENEPPMMWNSNYAGQDFWGFQTYVKTGMMLSSLGGVVGDSAVLRAHREWAEAWLFKHPSPWDWMFSMQRSLNRDLGWFFNAWLFQSAGVDGSIESATTSGGRTVVTVRQDGEMPSPVILEVKFAAGGRPGRAMPNAVMTDSVTALVTYPVDVWFGGSRTFAATLDFGGVIERITLDPGGRFPDRTPADNVWPRN